MGNQIYFQLITPLIFLVFASGFWSVYVFDKNLKAAKFLGISYLFGASGFVFDFFWTSLPLSTAVLTTSISFTLASVFFAIAIAVRSNQSPPLKTLGLLVATMIISQAYFIWVEPSSHARELFVNFLNGAIFILAFWSIVKQKELTVVDKFIAGWVFVTSMQFFLRPTLVHLLSTDVALLDKSALSVTGLAFHFSVAFVAIGLAATLFIAIGMDIVVDLRKRSETDVLSGLYNRRGFEEIARDNLEKLDRSGSTACLVVCDIDQFKSVNDTFGHPAGDAVISQIGELLSANSRQTDICGRVGGEEFCILLWNCDEQNGKVKAEEIRSTIEDFDFVTSVGKLNCTASFGLAVYRKGMRYDQLFKEADKALYQAKNGGRNRVITANSDSKTTPVLVQDSPKAA